MKKIELNKTIMHPPKLVMLAASAPSSDNLRWRVIKDLGYGILHRDSEIDAQVWSNLCSLICSWHLIRSRAVTNQTSFS